MKRRLPRIIGALAIIAMLIVSVVPTHVQAAAAWYDTAWQYRKSITITGSPDGAQTNYPVKIILQDRLAAPYTNPVALGNDASQVYSVVGNYLYWARNYNSSPGNVGDFYKTNLVNGDTTFVLQNVVGLAAFEDVLVGTDIYLAGQAVMSGQAYPYMALTLWKIDTTNDNVTSAQLDQGNADHEFVGIDSDGTNFICGSIAGEIWQVPIATWDNSATWSKKWTDTNTSYSNTVVNWTNGRVYVSLLGANQRWRVVSAPVNDLTSFTEEFTYWSQGSGTHTNPYLAVCGNTLVALGYVAATSSYHMRVFNGATWDDHDLTIPIEAEATDIYGVWLANDGKLAITVSKTVTRTHDVYTVSLDGTNRILENNDIAGSANGWSPRQGTQASYNATYYYSTLQSAAPTFINRLSRGNSLSNHNNADFSDIRFTASDGTTLLSYWQESVTNSSESTFWVNIPSIGASPNTVSIYVYYGNASVTTTSSITSTFPFADDFSGSSMDAAKWFHWLNNGTTTVSGGVAAFVGNVSYNGWGAKVQFGTNYAYRGGIRIDVDNSGADLLIFGADDRSANGTPIGSGIDKAGFRVASNNPLYENMRENTATTAVRGFTFAPAGGAYVTTELQRNSNTDTRFVMNGFRQGLISTNVPLDNMGIEMYSNSAARTIYWNWVLARPFTANEPNPATLGAETSPVPPTPTATSIAQSIPITFVVIGMVMILLSVLVIVGSTGTGEATGSMIQVMAVGIMAIIFAAILWALQ